VTFCCFCYDIKQSIFACYNNGGDYVWVIFVVTHAVETYHTPHNNAKMDRRIDGFMYVGYGFVIVRQTDIHTDGHSLQRASIASRGNKNSSGDEIANVNFFTTILHT